MVVLIGGSVAIYGVVDSARKRVSRPRTDVPRRPVAIHGDATDPSRSSFPIVLFPISYSFLIPISLILASPIAPAAASPVFPFAPDPAACLQEPVSSNRFEHPRDADRGRDPAEPPS